MLMGSPCYSDNASSASSCARAVKSSISCHRQTPEGQGPEAPELVSSCSSFFSICFLPPVLSCPNNRVYRLRQQSGFDPIIGGNFGQQTVCYQGNI